MSGYGRTFAHWRDASPGWEAYVGHDFVKGLGDGTLPRAAFLHYLVQDYVFLIHFARAWSLALVKAETLSEMKVCAGTVDALVNHEMQLHIETCRAEGIAEDQLFAATEEVENLAYTRFVIDAGVQGDFLDMMAALAPCVLGYGEIGTRLAGRGGPYKPWIDTYAGDAYQGVCASVGGMIDAGVARRVGPDAEKSTRWAALQARFDTATRLEAGFWSMGLRGA